MEKCIFCQKDIVSGEPKGKWTGAGNWSGYACKACQDERGLSCDKTQDEGLPENEKSSQSSKKEYSDKTICPWCLEDRTNVGFREMGDGIRKCSCGEMFLVEKGYITHKIGRVEG